MPENYSKVTLSPRNEEDRRKFMSFRNDDVVQMLWYLTVLATGEAVLKILDLIYTLYVGDDFDIPLI